MARYENSIVNSSQATNLSSHFDFGDLDAGFQIFSRVPLNYSNGRIRAGELTTLTLEEWQSVELIREFRQTTDLFVRVKVDDTAPADQGWSNWVSKSVISVIPPKQITKRGIPSLEFSFSFPTEYPSHHRFSNKIFDFVELTADQKNAFRRVFEILDQYSPAVVSEIENANLVPLAKVAEVFASRNTVRIAKPIHAFLSQGSRVGHDIVIDPDSPLLQGDSIKEGGEGFFEIMRAVASSFGLTRTAELDRLQTIVGRRSSATVPFGVPFNQNFSPADILRLNFGDTDPVRPMNEGDTIHAFDRTPLTKMISDTQGSDTIDVSAAPSSWHVDLRPGKVSYNLVEPINRITFSIDHYTEIEKFIGQRQTDFVVGNHQRNRLMTGDGKDILDGRQGDDVLMGGKHADVYVFRPGYGHDTINETGSGGNDRLTFRAIPGLDKLHEDVSFDKLGNDLRINLNIDGSNLNGDSVLIKNQGNRRSKIETLIFANQTGNFLRVDLRSVWNQLTDGERMAFAVINTSNRFGNLVTPVS